MFNNNQYNQGSNFSYSNQESKSIVVPKTFIASVFSWMTIALGITAFTAYYFGTNEAFFNSLYSINDTTGKVEMSLLGWVISLAPIAVFLTLSIGINKFSVGFLTLLFIAFSILMGMSLSLIFTVYTSSSIFITFAITASTFGVMAITGYITKTDLTKFGSILMMGFIGIFIASIVNIFIGSGTMQWLISLFGVLIFTGLTASDTQKLKRIGAGVQFGSEPSKKLIIMGALTLYMDFILLFQYLLFFMGNRK